MTSSFKSELSELLNKHNVRITLDISFVDDKDGNQTIDEIEIAVVDKATNAKIDTIGDFNYHPK